MPSDKHKVSLFLSTEELKEYDRLKLESNANNSELVMNLVKERLASSQTPVRDDEYDTKWEERLRLLEAQAENNKHVRQCQAQKLDNTNYKVAYLFEEIELLREELNPSPIEQLTDDVIAAVTGQREETVKEWRHGLRKPRGERILKKLAPYEVKEGRWVRLKA